MADKSIRTDEKKVSLKLLVDTKANRVLFAEANKEFVDFLFQIFSLPIGTVVRLLSAKGMVGSLCDLYKSIEDLNTDYLQPNVKKDSVLKPKCAVAIPLLSLDGTDPNGKNFSRCSNHSGFGSNDPGAFAPLFSRCSNHFGFVSNDPGAFAPLFSSKMSTNTTYVAPKGPGDATTSSNGGGYVKGVVTYMVMDNLQVKPMSTISCLTILNKFRVQDVSSLEEREVQVGLNEGVALLKASLETRATLTAVFLGLLSSSELGM